MDLCREDVKKQWYEMTEKAIKDWWDNLSVDEQVSLFVDIGICDDSDSIEIVRKKLEYKKQCPEESNHILPQKVFEDKKKQFIEFAETHNFSEYVGESSIALMSDECMYYKEYPSSCVIVLCSNNLEYQPAILSFVVLDKKDCCLSGDMYENYNYAVRIYTNDIDLLATIDRLDCKDISVS